MKNPILDPRYDPARNLSLSDREFLAKTVARTAVETALEHAQRHKPTTWTKGEALMLAYAACFIGFIGGILAARLFL